MNRMLCQVLPQNGIHRCWRCCRNTHALHPFANELPCVLSFPLLPYRYFSRKDIENMANNEYKSYYLDSLALNACFYLVYVISLHCDNQIEQVNMKAIQFNSANVVKSAIKCMDYEMDAATSISKGMMIETLKKRMMRGEVVRFCYQKLDGTIRYAVGTLQSDAVKANVAGTGTPKRYYGMFAYLDLEKMAWRGFKEERIIGIVD